MSKPNSPLLAAARVAVEQIDQIAVHAHNTANLALWRILRDTSDQLGKAILRAEREP
jgi:hypothetical protein